MGRSFDPDCDFVFGPLGDPVGAQERLARVALLSLLVLAVDISLIWPFQQARVVESAGDIFWIAVARYETFRGFEQFILVV